MNEIIAIQISRAKNEFGTYSLVKYSKVNNGRAKIRKENVRILTDWAKVTLVAYLIKYRFMSGKSSAWYTESAITNDNMLNLLDIKMTALFGSNM